MASRSDGTDASQRAVMPFEGKQTSNVNEDDIISSLPPQTPTAPKAPSSSLPTPPSSSGKHRFQSSSLRSAARAFLAMPPSPASPASPASRAPPPAPSPPAALSDQRISWQGRMSAQKRLEQQQRLQKPSSSSSSSSSSSTPAAAAVPKMPSTPLIPRKETPDIAPLPQDQQFCACCDNNWDTNTNTNKGKGKQKTDRGNGQTVHGDGTTSQPARDRRLSKLEAQIQAAKAYMMQRKQGSGAGGLGGGSTGGGSDDGGWQQQGSGSS